MTYGVNIFCSKTLVCGDTPHFFFIFDRKLKYIFTAVYAEYKVGLVIKTYYMLIIKEIITPDSVWWWSTHTLTLSACVYREIHREREIEREREKDFFLKFFSLMVTDKNRSQGSATAQELDITEKWTKEEEGWRRKMRVEILGWEDFRLAKWLLWGCDRKMWWSYDLVIHRKYCTEEWEL